MSKKIDLVRELLDRNCLLTPEANELLKDIDINRVDIEKLADAIKDEIVVTAEKLKSVLDSFDLLQSNDVLADEISKSPKAIDKTIKDPVSKIKKKTTVKKEQTDFNPIGKTIKEKIKVILESSGKTTVEGSKKDFSSYFISRYKQLREIIRNRGDVLNTIYIRDLNRAKLEEREQFTIIGMVKGKRTLKNGGMLLEIEDTTGNITINISAKMQELIGKAGALLEDQVAGFYGRFYEDIFLLNDFIFPDIPITQKKLVIDDPVSVCFTSDLHIGSKEFLEDAFKRLINFLNGHVDDPYQRTLASQVKYLIVNGDVVEGIGVYPNQEEDLIITDIYDQYKKAAQLLSKVPKWIQILILSGNHDACRLALPQPAISEEYAPDLWKMPNVTMLSNPSTVEIHGKIFLLYHGNSFEDVASLTPGLNMNDPNGPMIYTLRFRHLAPTYGRRTSIVPSKKDELVIEKVPHIYHTGHIHINSHTQYRGVDCINSGTFQSQTDFMQSKNIIPTPARVPIMNLQSNKLSELVFFDESEIKQ
jgi:DNA polymerase II small subunit